MKNVTVIVPNQNKSEVQLNLSLEEAREYIYSIDFSMIINKFVRRHKWLRIEATETCNQYRNYLYLLKKYGTKSPLPPSEGIDEFWHHHILDTKKYIEDCEIIFGSYLKHMPDYFHHKKSTENKLNDYFTRTKRLYKSEFGESLMSKKYYFKPLLRLIGL